MPSHEERAREILEGLAAFGHIGFHAGTTDADHAVGEFSKALAEVEREALERAAKLLDESARRHSQGAQRQEIEWLAQSIRSLIET